MAQSAQLVFLCCGVVKNARTRKGIRYSLYDLAETNHGKIRPNENDGIFYIDDEVDLTFQLVFESERDAEEFQSAVLKISKNGFNIAPPLQIDRFPIVSISFPSELTRVLLDDFVQTEPLDSPEFDIQSRSLTIAVDLNEEIRLKLIDSLDSSQLIRLKPKKCYILSQKAHKQYQSNPNNIIYMSQFLHQHHDVINSTEGISTFYFHYNSHLETPILGILNGQSHPVYETKIDVVFKDEEALTILRPFFKESSRLSQTSIQLVLFFPNPEEFKHFSQIREDFILATWASYDGLPY